MNDSTSADGTQEIRNPEVGGLGDDPAGNGAAEHRDAFDDLPLREDRLERPAFAQIAAFGERIDEPGFHGS